MRVAIIGGGAAGCFASIGIRRDSPATEVTVYESGRALLSKVSRTGGGRCNLTNAFLDAAGAASVYPRGGRLMRRLLKEFGPGDACRWFESAGVPVVVQEDGCVFPRSQDAMDVVGALKGLMSRHGVSVALSHRVASIGRLAGGGFRLGFVGGGEAAADVVLAAVGGVRKAVGLGMFRSLGVGTVDPAPSLFSLCVADPGLRELQGVTRDGVTVTLAGTGLRASGAILVTHWGLSGPAVLRLSSYGARELLDRGYRAVVAVNWMGDMTERDAAAAVMDLGRATPGRKVANTSLGGAGSRLWRHILAKARVEPGLRCSELSQGAVARLAANLTGAAYEVTGRFPHKEEFVTAGGVALASVNPSTLEARDVPGLFFAGEVLDVDGLTGGFNLQAAWSTGHVAGKAIAALAASREGRGRGAP